MKNKSKELLVVSNLINNVGVCRETVEDLTKWGYVKESDEGRNMRKKNNYNCQVTTLLYQSSVLLF